MDEYPVVRKITGDLAEHVHNALAQKDRLIIKKDEQLKRARNTIHAQTEMILELGDKLAAYEASSGKQNFPNVGWIEDRRKGERRQGTGRRVRNDWPPYRREKEGRRKGQVERRSSGDRRKG